MNQHHPELWVRNKRLPKLSSEERELARLLKNRGIKIRKGVAIVARQVRARLPHLSVDAARCAVIYDERVCGYGSGKYDWNVYDL